MRLSEIKGERVFEVMAEVIEPICNIAADEAALALFKGDRPKDADATEYAISKIRNSLPTLVRSHGNDLARIMAATDGVSLDEYLADMTVASLIAGIYQILTDDELLSFLR